MIRINSHSSKNSTIQSLKKSPILLHDAMETNLIHLFDGTITIGSNWLNIALTILLITISFILNGIQSLILNVNISTLIVSALMYIIIVLMIIRIITKDPGIITKISKISYDLDYIPNNNNCKPSQLLLNNMFNQQLKYCEQCGIYQTNTTFHCNKCQICILEHDHHCNWLGKCIGKYNHSIFVWFLGFFIIFISSMIVGSSFSLTKTRNAWLVLVCINIFSQSIAFIYIFQLLCFHLVLIFKGFTTRTYYKHNIGQHGCSNFYKLFNTNHSQYFQPKKLVYKRKFQQQSSQIQLKDNASSEAEAIDKKTDLILGQQDNDFNRKSISSS